MAIFTCTLNPNLLLEAELEAAAAPGRTNPCGRALRMLPWQLPLPGSNTPSRAEGSLCPGITFRVPCWASWQELSPGGARSLEARQELCSSSASKASAPKHLGQAPQPLAAHPAVLYPSQNLRSKRSVTAGPAVQLPVPRGALSTLLETPIPVQDVPTFPKSGAKGPAPYTIPGQQRNLCQSSA